MFRNSTHSGESSSFLLTNQFIKNMAENKNHKIVRVTKCGSYLFFVKCVKDEAKKRLLYFNIEYSGIGEYVVSQSPKAFERIEMGSSVRLMLGDAKNE